MKGMSPSHNYYVKVNISQTGKTLIQHLNLKSDFFISKLFLVGKYYKDNNLSSNQTFFSLAMRIWFLLYAQAFA